MDPFSAEGELLNIHNFFHQGQYQEVIDFDASTLSPENALPARIFSLRAQIALGHADDVLVEIAGENEPELLAVGALAEFDTGDEEKAVETAEKLAGENGENGVVQVLAGTVLQKAGKSEEALALLGLHQGNCMSTFWGRGLVWADMLMGNSGGCCADCTDPLRAEQTRPSFQRGCSCEEVGTR
jgi:coatomer protein complex subunit epsilon